MKFSIKDFFSKCFLRIWSHLLKKFLMKNFIFCAVILTVKNNDNDSWTFLTFFDFTIVFPLELETRLYYLSITIATDTSPAQMGCSRTRKTLKFDNFSHFQNVLSNPPPFSSVMTHCVRKSICDSPLKNRNSRSQMFLKIGILKNFANFAGKHLYFQHPL